VISPDKISRLVVHQVWCTYKYKSEHTLFFIHEKELTFSISEQYGQEPKMVSKDLRLSGRL